MDHIVTRLTSIDSNMSYHKLLLYLILTSILAGVKNTEVSECSDSSTLPDSVEIANCDEPPCILYTNTNNSITMIFKSPRYLEKFAPSALLYVMDLPPEEYPLGQDDACVGITNTLCPIIEDEYVEYTYGLILSNVDPGNLTLEFSLLDKEQNDERVECFRVAMEVKS